MAFLAGCAVDVQGRRNRPAARGSAVEPRAAEHDGAVGAPGAAAGVGGRGERLDRPGRGFELPELGLGEEADEARVGRPEGLASALRALEPAGVAAVEAPEPQVALARRRFGGEDERPPVGRDHHLIEAGARRCGQGEDHGFSGRRRLPPGRDRGEERDGGEAGRGHQQGGPAAVARGRDRPCPDRAGGGGARPLQVVAGVRDVAQALAWVALEAAPEHVANRGWRPCGEAAPVDLAREDGGENVRDRLAVEQPLAGQHLEQHDTEGPDVGALVDRLAPRLLGRHVGGGAEDDPGRGAGLGEGGRLRESAEAPRAARPSRALARPKSRTLTLPSGVTFTLAGLRSRWTMPFSCASSRASATCFAIADRLVDRNRPALQALGEILALDQLHDQEVDRGPSSACSRARRGGRCRGG